VPACSGPFRESLPARFCPDGSPSHIILVRSRHSPRGERTGGCGEANNGSGTDWAVAVNEKANVKTEPHEKTIVANLKQFLMPMGTTFRAGTSQGAKSSRAGFVQLLNHTKENLGRAYSRLRIAHASRDLPLLSSSNSLWCRENFRHLRYCHLCQATKVRVAN